MIRPKRPYEIFHELSRIEGRHMLEETWQDSSLWPREWIEFTPKTYPRMRHIPLPDQDLPCEASLLTALHDRRSIREPSPAPLLADQLAFLLRNSLGFRHAESSQLNRRLYPSAGARFPLECYLVVMRCSGIDPGLYHYEVHNHCLSELLVDALSPVVKSIYGQEWTAQARVVLFLSAVMARTTVKYGERGYRHALVEAGHVAQNLCLVGTALGVPVTPVAGFADQRAHRLLDLGDVGEIVLYSAVLP